MGLSVFPFSMCGLVSPQLGLLLLWADRFSAARGAGEHDSPLLKLRRLKFFTAYEFALLRWRVELNLTFRQGQRIMMHVFLSVS